MTATHILAIDQGTTSSRAIVFDGAGRPVATAQKELTQHFPADGWVEHDAGEIWRDTLSTCRQALEIAGLDAGDIAAIGITNQRETTVVWDRATGQPIARAIVWQDRRTADQCRRLHGDGHLAAFRARTGLLLDPYFSGTKLSWLLDHVDGARARAEKGELAFGTIDSWLIWKLTGGRLHATDATNASRTLLFNIREQAWDKDLCAILRVPMSLLPEVRDCAGDFGQTAPDLFGAPIPIRGVAGDQQAAMVGQACFEPGMIKSTYGTGCFALIHIGGEPALSRNRLLTTVAYRLEGQVSYAIEGSIFTAGAAVQWLRDGLGLVKDAAETEALAQSVPDAGGVFMVPAFTGLGAPWWDPHARGAILGLTRDSKGAHIVRATLEAQGFQTRDLLDAMAADSHARPAALRVDGGMVRNNLVCQLLADLTGVPVERPMVTETTALGAAYLAGLASGVWDGLDRISAAWACERRFAPELPAATRDRRHQDWHAAIARIRTA